MELSDSTEKTAATSGIDPGAFRIVAKCLNHYATPGPNKYTVKIFIQIYGIFFLQIFVG
jgi:hypothetical protein